MKQGLLATDYSHESHKKKVKVIMIKLSWCRKFDWHLTSAVYNYIIKHASS